MLHALRAEQFWGQGIESLFPEGAFERRVVPWDQAHQLKHFGNYDQSLVADALRRPPVLQEIDPRTLRATQPHILRGGVEHYLTDEYHKTGQTFEQGQRRGNEYPFIYRREPSPANPDSGVQNLILAGHHRSAAALVQGRPLRAIIVEGPWGAPR